jgi:hypothetical protein
MRFVPPDQMLAEKFDARMVMRKPPATAALR